MRRHPSSPRRRGRRRSRLLLLFVVSTVLLILLSWISSATIDPSRDPALPSPDAGRDNHEDGGLELAVEERREGCATVEKMGEAFAVGSENESLRVRELIQHHFDLHGAARVRGLSPHEFCKQGFVIGKSSEAGFGNEMYKILTAAALSIMLNRSLIIGQTRGSYPFGEYISYTNHSFTLKEVKHLWRKNKCGEKYGRNLVVRVDNFEHPSETNVLCSDWRLWKQPIIWFQGTNDAVAIQFFLKNVHPGMKNAASILFGEPESFHSRPNVFGELMRIVISPSLSIKDAVDQILKSGDPDIALHMRMLANRSVRAIQAAVKCIKRAVHDHQPKIARPQVVVVSDTPSLVSDIRPHLAEFAEVIHFDYKLFKGNISIGSFNRQHQPLDFRVKDWGPAPRWVAFVDFFLASRAKHAVVSGAHRRVGTTYAQLIAALAAANQYGKKGFGTSNFSFFSSFHSNLLAEGLKNQIGWGHIWNRFAGPLSCRHQRHQCAFTPLLPPAWWDSEWQSPIPRDIHRLQTYGVQLTEDGKVIESSLNSFCKSRKEYVKILRVSPQCKNSKCA
ncbi:uncharacterized protein LOC120261555 isoform X1 [Dioscorea cayenensis subsp. rotundata]|uniref:Uncharacterized protein LOC120261555 isoform X1 n=1 Tax=Dioscorea cayennensis subsp. rotundata TaxID=55577 RepID=A0AB40BDN8_DIOCR|nr:uncharacterized protein LOC120261555 isoform X1 [Dioscorea cayenensis subsp. rotundata]